MKTFFTLAIVLTAFASQAFADTTIAITKAGANTAKVCTFPQGKCLGTAPISFDGGASFDSLKDSYTVSDATASQISAKQIAFSVDGDGKVTFTTAKKSAKCAAACKAKSKK